MSNTYIGPFGRILPITEDYDLSQSPKSPPSNMLTRKMPPLPDMFAFGSDPTPGFTDPNRYSRSQKPNPSSRPHMGEALPPVSQLLSPVSPTGGDACSFSSRFRTGSPSEPSSGYPSPHPEEYNAPSYHRQGGNAFPGHISRGSHPQSQYTNIGRDSLPPSMISPQHRPSYPSSLERSRTDWQPSPPTPSSTPFPWPPVQRPEYRTAGPSVSPHLREPLSTVKPNPKVVCEKTIPGEGPCYVYEDGTHVRKFIDGELVNAQWGITKAGRPRRRLAIACMTCREKKIKCDPTDLKCVQCDKSGRECHFQSA